jgi:hypothetical protein
MSDDIPRPNGKEKKDEYNFQTMLLYAFEKKKTSSSQEPITFSNALFTCFFTSTAITFTRGLARNLTRTVSNPISATQ